MFEKVILSKIKIPHVKVNTLLLVSYELFDSHFVPKISTLRRDFYLSDKLAKSLRNSSLELYPYNAGIVP